MAGVLHVKHGRRAGHTSEPKREFRILHSIATRTSIVDAGHLFLLMCH
jgi:hypothetical protein